MFTDFFGGNIFQPEAPFFWMVKTMVCSEDFPKKTIEMLLLFSWSFPNESVADVKLTCQVPQTRLGQ